MRWWRWWRRDDESRGDPEAARDELLSAYLDGEATPTEAAELERELAAAPTLRAELDELGALRDALSELGELRAPRPFTLEAPPQRARGGLGRLELATRAGVFAVAVAFAVVLTGDLVDLGGGDSTTPVRESAARPETLEATSDAVTATADAGDAGAGEAAPAEDAAAPAPATGEAAAADGATPTQAADADDDTAAARAPTATARRDEPRTTEGADDGAPAAAASPEPTFSLTPMPAATAVVNGAEAPPAAPAGADDGAATTDEGADAGATPSAAETPAAAAGQATAQPAATTTPEAVATLAEDDEDAPEGGESASEVAPADAEEGPVELTRAVEAEDDGGALRVAEVGLLVAAVALAVLAIGQRLARRRGGPVA